MNSTVTPGRSAVRLPCHLGDQDFRRLAQEFVALVTEQALGLGVHQRDPPAAVHAYHRVRCSLEQPAGRVIGDLHA
jgi:hypothetical protein